MNCSSFLEKKREEVLKKYFNKVFVRDDTNSTIYFDGTEMKYYRKIKKKPFIRWEWEMHLLQDLPSRFAMGTLLKIV
jgi:hypothetical protein